VLAPLIEGRELIMTSIPFTPREKVKPMGLKKAASRTGADSLWDDCYNAPRSLRLDLWQIIEV
jgi:hypothetical protein